jgi:hypothetical protein
MARMLAKNQDGKMILTHNFETWPTIIEPKDYAQLLKVESSLEQRSSRAFLLQGGVIAE